MQMSFSETPAICTSVRIMTGEYLDTLSKAVLQVVQILLTCLMSILSAKHAIGACFQYPVTFACGLEDLATLYIIFYA